MQVSNSTLSAALFSAIRASAAGSNQPAVQYPLQPVTIEGQIVKDEQKSNSPVKNRNENLFLEKETQQQQSSNSQVDNSASHLLIQAKLNNSAQPANSPESVTNTESEIPHVNNFPFSNRRSFNGLAGEHLVLQSYLNNEPANRFIADSMPKHIDIFI